MEILNRNNAIGTPNILTNKYSFAVIAEDEEATNEYGDHEYEGGYDYEYDGGEDPTNYVPPTSSNTHIGDDEKEDTTDDTTDDTDNYTTTIPIQPKENNNKIIAIVAGSLLGLGAIIGVFFYLKRKY